MEENKLFFFFPKGYRIEYVLISRKKNGERDFRGISGKIMLKKKEVELVFTLSAQSKT